MSDMKVKLISYFYIGYLKLLSKTCKIRIIKPEDVDINNSIIGFWHGESFPMYLLFERYPDVNMSAIATSDKRGEYITAIMADYGIKPLRLANGAASRRGISEIINLGKQDTSLSICFSIDGPLGPYHEPKKMVFFIAESCGKKYISIRPIIKGKITAFSRWDKYVIPLPFSSITFDVREYGMITKEQIKDFDRLSKEIINHMEGS
ncbi:MAG: hypothetical protein IIW54_05905 [Lachnospiraceae bacterium]|nr:hypothetical protein [Lachnospiraceae bacterium]